MIKSFIGLSVISIIVYFIFVYMDAPKVYLFLFLAIAGIIRISILLSKKTFTNFKILEIEKNVFEKIYHDLPFEIKAIEKLDFFLFDKFKIKSTRIDSVVLIFKSKNDSIFYNVSYYPNQHRAFPFFITYFSNSSDLITTNSIYIKSLPLFDDYYYQYLKDMSNSDLLNYHKEGIKTLMLRKNLKMRDFKNPELYRTHILEEQKKNFEKLGSFVFFKFIKNYFMNDLSKISKPISMQNV